MTSKTRYLVSAFIDRTMNNVVGTSPMLLRQYSIICIIYFWLVLPIGISGCSESGSGRVAVTGKVSFNGTPLSVGQITFEPLEKGLAAGGEIKNGSFDIPRDKGPMPGKYKVRINSMQPTGKKIPTKRFGDELVDEVREAIPAKYNVKSELVAELSDGDTKTLDFALGPK